MLMRPELSVAMFRYVPKRGDADAFNERLIQAVRKDGRVFLSSSQVDGRFILRVAVLSFRTHIDTIDLTIEILRQAVLRMEAGSSDPANLPDLKVRPPKSGI